MLKNTLLVVSMLAALGAVAACERSEPAASAPSSSGGVTIPAGLFAAAPEGEAVSVLEAKASSSQGDKVLVRGRIGGSAAPFVDGRAMFTIVDASMLACSDTPGDGCKTPWDYCCEQPADIARHAATVQVTGADDSVLRASLKGQGGLRELSTVVVRGTVAQIDDGVLVIDADTISVDPAGAASHD